MNRLVNYEIHLPSALTAEEVGMTLIDDSSGGPQTLCVSLKFLELFEPRILQGCLPDH